MIAANEVPDHTTIARFRQRHEAALAERALTSVLAKVSQAIGASAAEVDDPCHRCVHDCSLIVITEDDPFARIICMLNCPCPG